MEYYAVLKKVAILTHATICMNLENITLIERKTVTDIPLWHRWLRIQHHSSCGTGSIPDLRTSTKKKKEGKNQSQKYEYYMISFI